MIRSEYLLCRMFRSHALEGFYPLDKRGPGWGRTFFFRCTRCGTERHDTIDSLGDISTRRYVYPKDYSIAGEEQPETRDLRLQYQKGLRAERSARNARNNKRRAS